MINWTSSKRLKINDILEEILKETRIQSVGKENIILSAQVFWLLHAHLNWWERKTKDRLTNQTEPNFAELLFLLIHMVTAWN